MLIFLLTVMTVVCSWALISFNICEDFVWLKARGEITVNKCLTFGDLMCWLLTPYY